MEVGTIILLEFVQCMSLFMAHLGRVVRSASCPL